LDFIVARGYEKEVVEAFCLHLAPELRRGTVLLLNEIPESSPNLALWRGQAARLDMIWSEADLPCATTPLPASWDAYVGTLKPRFRTKVRSVLRNLETRPDVRFGFCDTADHIRAMLPILFDLHTRRWAKDGKPGVFRWDAKREFYLALSLTLFECGWLRFSWMEWNRRILACQYGFVYRDTYFHLQEGYEPASEHWNVGIGLRAWSTREFINQGVREYDFLGGVRRHKADWGAVQKQSKQIVLASPSYKNLLFCRGPEWDARSRESLKKIVPDRILSACQALLQPSSAPVNGNAHSNQRLGTRWLRQTAANFYLHLGMPAVVRPLRERYRFSVPKNGATRRISLSRKTAPAARILYYHRVNDERDPYFPAISTALFEQEMRFAAKHYKIVRLADLLLHLEEGPPQDVLAITFDDGYGDNYENAFPILRQYGLPATIFLTTGGIDSRQLMWFEQLAHALKKTSKEFIDLEIDLPRRFWTRTESERLQSNQHIFELLRTLSDAERRQWLEYICRELRVDDGDLRANKMLTWDQVRAMHAHGIDFGGHTVTHPFLSKMPPDQVTWEVSESKRRIEQELQAQVLHFAYPNGREEDFTACNKQAIRNAGYRAAVTTIWGMNDRSTDPMELRRGQPWEESPALFACKLDWYQLVNG
jgi:peptidoglycan/xylan/chitin deacetylase (PgdA/CDA1 family)